MNEIRRIEAATEPRIPDLCPNCESPNVVIDQRDDRFMYGVGEHATELTASVPVHICTSCGFEYTDDVGERLRHEAVCAYLGILTPAEIVAIRDSYNRSRRQFANMTRIGLASLARWETGEGLQNPAMDSYLRLISHKHIFELTQRADFLARREDPRAQKEKFQALRKLNLVQQARMSDQAKDFQIEQAKAA